MAELMPPSPEESLVAQVLLTKDRAVVKAALRAALRHYPLSTTGREIAGVVAEALEDDSAVAHETRVLLFCLVLCASPAARHAADGRLFQSNVVLKRMFVTTKRRTCLAHALFLAHACADEHGPVTGAGSVEKLCVPSVLAILTELRAAIGTGCFRGGGRAC